MEHIKSARLTIEIDADLKNKMQAAAREEGRTMTYYLTKWIKAYLQTKPETQKEEPVI